MNHTNLRQIARYGFVGLINNFTLYLAYLFLTYVNVEPKLAMTVVYVVGTAISFLANRTWTFNYQGNFSKTVLRYVVAQSLGYLLNFFILLVFVDHLGYPHQWIQAISIVAVAIFLFISLKYFVFPARSVTAS